MKLKNQDYLNLFSSMYLIRKTEEAIAKNYTKGHMRCPVHLSIGQEAIAAGVCNALNNKDQIISTHRSHAHYLAKGGNLNKMLAELHGKINGCARGVGGSMHLQDYKSGVIASVPIVGSTIPIGVGVAFSNKLLKKNNVVVIFFGEAATEQGVFHESINFAKLHKLSILFVCENNLYSVYTNLSKRQSSERSIINIAKSNGILGKRQDGNDVIGVNRLTFELINYIKKNNSPALIEMMTYRWLEHCGPNWDDSLQYRPKGELNKWIKNVL